MDLSRLVPASEKRPGLPAGVADLAREDGAEFAEVILLFVIILNK
jgi:hypothetical protein